MDPVGLNVSFHGKLITYSNYQIRIESFANIYVLFLNIIIKSNLVGDEAKKKDLLLASDPSSVMNHITI
jgi:hypothetical protein